MKRRAALLVPAAAIAVTAVVLSAGRGGPAEDGALADWNGGCSPSPAVGRQLAAPGEGLAAVDGVTPVLVGADRVTRPLPVPPGQGVIRQVVHHPAYGVAVVDDLAGADRVAATSPDGTRSLDGGGEVPGLTWTPRGDLAWAVDGRMLRVAGTDGRSTRVVKPPHGTLGAYAPLFLAPDRLVAVVEEAPPRGSRLRAHEATVLSNLWSHDLTAGRWTKLTRFTVAGDRWSALQTPLAAPDGDIVFTRVHGDAYRTGQPEVALWRLRRGTARMLQTLPAGTVLAGWLGGRLVVNQPDPHQQAWRLLWSTGGGLVAIGCGTVLVPAAGPDPDDAAPHPGRDTQPPTAAEPLLGADPPTLAVAIGDFPSRAAADGVRARFADRSGWRVMGHRDAPRAVRPGAWILVQAIPAGEDPAARLGHVRRAHPEHAELAYVVILG